MTLQSVLAVVSRTKSPQRWSAAIEVCAHAADQVGIDPAVPVVRSLMRPEIRPSGASVPSAITVFAPALALAGLLPKSA